MKNIALFALYIYIYIYCSYNNENRCLVCVYMDKFSLSSDN